MTLPGPDNDRLMRALEQLHSDDVSVQNQGVRTVIQIGARAVPALLPLLDEKRSGLSSQAMYAMARIAEPTAEGAFLKGLKDDDERVRAYAAVGLARINHPEALAACLMTLNDAPDESHLDMTPAVRTLGDMGMRAIPALLNLLMHEESITRLHAQRALELIVNQRHGFHPGQGFPTPDAEAESLAEWRANGNYHYSDAPEMRAAAVEKWRDRLRE